MYNKTNRRSTSTGNAAADDGSSTQSNDKPKIKLMVGNRFVSPSTYYRDRKNINVEDDVEDDSEEDFSSRTSSSLEDSPVHVSCSRDSVSPVMSDVNNVFPTKDSFSEGSYSDSNYPDDTDGDEILNTLEVVPDADKYTGNDDLLNVLQEVPWEAANEILHVLRNYSNPNDIKQLPKDYQTLIGCYPDINITENS